jgi:nucleotide-binding universal stress UspA family protein
MDVFSRMLVAVDGSPPSDAAVRLAVHLAISGPKPLIRFVSVADRAAFAGRLEGECREAVDAACAQARTAGIEATPCVLTGSAAAEIVVEADAWNATCIAIGTHGRSGMAHALLGSCAESVLHRSARPVLVAPAIDAVAPPSGTLARVLCAFDGSAAARRAFETAAALAAERDAELHLLTVIPIDHLYATGYERDGFDPDGSIGRLYDDARSELKTLAASAAARRARIALHVAGGFPAAAVIAACAAQYQCGIIVMGTHGRRGLVQAVLGSTAATVIRGGIAPVLVVHERVHVPVPVEPAAVSVSNAS